jgi:hypothetical protein
MLQGCTEFIAVEIYNNCQPNHGLRGDGTVTPLDSAVRACHSL